MKKKERKVNYNLPFIHTHQCEKQHVLQNSLKYSEWVKVTAQ